MPSMTESSKETQRPNANKSTWRMCFELMRLHHFPVGTKLPFTALALGMLMGLQSTHGRSLSTLYTKAILWWLFVFIRHCMTCVWNDICDRDIDRLVERTKTRPLASGDMSMRGACLLLSILTLLTLTMLRIASGSRNFRLWLGCAGLAAFDMPYPLMKRWTNIPQLCLSASIVWPIPIAWLSVTGGSYQTTTLLMLCIAFGGSTFILDTIYACQDRSEDIQVGVKSAAILFGTHIRSALSALATMVVISLFIAGITCEEGYSYFVITVGGVALAYARQLQTTNFDDEKQCGKALTVSLSSEHAAVAIIDRISIQ
ncbi:UbiA prenyltransferase family-domain-containing protein [Irpex lacteus]|nr:UbiA prenyltransferase family-domain-containing protein [Irpex lacteus]